MKLVLSRKGFDSGSGKMPSPILPDGTLISLPIPSSADTNCFGNVYHDRIDVAGLVHDLSDGRYCAESSVHVDPDLCRPPHDRIPGWRPALGQTGTAQSHLGQMGVGKGDVFVFFGWFRRVEQVKGKWRFEKGAPDVHVAFGWLEIGEVLPIVCDRDDCIRRFPWIASHPHVVNEEHYTDDRNTLYVAARTSRYAGRNSLGGGRFRKFSEGLQLTAQGRSRSVWSLPRSFMPKDRPPLSYHSNPTRWITQPRGLLLKSAARGQEFVLDLSLYPEVLDWTAKIIQEGAKL